MGVQPGQLPNGLVVMLSHEVGAARVLQVFRAHKSRLRMQILTGSAAQRNRILRAAFLVSPLSCLACPSCLCFPVIPGT